MIKKLPIVFLLVTLIFIGILFFNQNWILLNFPFKDFTSIGQIKENGYISTLWRDTLLNLPVCDSTKSPFQDSPRVKYFLEAKSINLQEVAFKPVRVWGKVKVTSKYNPYTLCDPGPCGPITERIMTVDRVEVDTSPLLPCQQDYLEEMSKRPE